MVLCLCVGRQNPVPCRSAGKDLCCVKISIVFSDMAPLVEHTSVAHTSVAQHVRDIAAEAADDTVFTVDDFIMDGPSLQAVEAALSRLVRSDASFHRVRNGVYWKKTPSRFGVGRADRVKVALAAARGRGIGPTEWSASRYLGLSTQIPAMEHLVVCGTAPTRVEGVKWHQRSNYLRVGLQFSEIAVLELLRNWPRYAEARWEDVTEKVQERTKAGSVDLSRISAAAEGESRSVRALLTELRAGCS